MQYSGGKKQITIYCIFIKFRTISFRGGQTHNLEAARVSMPGQIRKYVYSITLILLVYNFDF